MDGERLEASSIGHSSSKVGESRSARGSTDITRRLGEEREGHVVVVGQWRQGHARLPLAYAAAVDRAGAKGKVFSTFTMLPAENAPQGLELELGLDPYDASPLRGAVGLVLPGGGDIDPAFYGEPRHPKTSKVSDRRDRFELTLLEGALALDLPVLAICHGMQLLNVHLGGTLDQHLADDPAKLEHDDDNTPAPVHDVRIQPGTVLAEALGTERTAVNSSHHQGLGRLADDLDPVAWAPDGVIEAVVAARHSWVVGVQWHPEIMAPHDPVQQRLFDAFVAAAYDARSAARAQPA